MTLVGEELAFNIFSYAYDGNPGAFTLRVCLCPLENKVTMEFRDKGKPFNPLEQPPPDLEADIDDREIGGLGITLSKQLTDRQVYKYEDGQNVLLVEKIIRPAKNAR